LPSVMAVASATPVPVVHVGMTAPYRDIVSLS
jgi:hypothetical protein